MRWSLLFTPVIALSLLACEDGPEQLFTPNTGDPSAQNGYSPGTPWVQTGTTSYDDNAGGSDSAGRAVFCDETEVNELIQEMVVKPIIPDESIGGIPLRGPDGKPYVADTLLGRPEDGKFCNPTGVYSDAFTWGPTDEVIVWINTETRLVEGLMAYQQYLGAMQGSFTDAGGNQVPVVVQPRERIKIAGRELDQYTSRADQATKPNAWLNFANVNMVYRMVRETFFDAPPFPADFDCITEQLCEVIYTTNNESTPQDTFILLQDSGLQVRLSPDGYAYFVYLTPVLGAPFEREGQMSFGQTGSSTMSFSYLSTMASCSLTLDEELTFAEFRSRCISPNDTRTLSRIPYDVAEARDSVDASFEGVTLSFLRQTSTSSVFRDGEAPKDDDVLYGIAFTRVLNAPVEEFRAITLGNLYKQKLQQRLFDSIIHPGPISREAHPFAVFNVRVPFLSNNPSRITALMTPGGQNWIGEVIRQVEALYYALPAEEQAMLDPQVLDPVYLTEPFVEAVLQEFTHGESNRASTVTFLRTTDDRRWSIGDAHFIRGGVPYRVQVQYSLDYGGISAVFLERGQSEIDRVFADLNNSLANHGPYYTLLQSRVTTGNPYSLGGDAITINGFNRQLDTLRVTLKTPGGAAPSIELTVPGLPIQDLNGYLRQIRGERFEFVPADEVHLYGKETSMAFWVEADGTIGRISQGLFKGVVELCPGLLIRFGDDVPQAIETWAASGPANRYRDCEIAFNYTANGNVLDSVASIANRVSVTVLDKNAVSAAIWR